MPTKTHIIASVYPLLFSIQSLIAQNRLLFDGGIMIFKNNVNLVVDNPNANGIQVLSSGKIISEAENNVVKWNIATSIGTYKVPFATSVASGLVNIPLEVNITTAGTNTGTIIFSTFETINDDNTAYPSDVANMNSNCNNNNALYAVDRFWKIDAQNYTTKPTPVINFGYNPNASEMAVTNIIGQASLKAQRFNAGAGSWETPQKLYGFANTTLMAVTNVSVSPLDFFKSWTLIDTSIMNIPIAITTQPSCDSNPTGAIAITLTGGTANHQVLWSNGGTGTNISQIASGVITATITNNNSCTTIYNTIIDEEKCLVTLIPQFISPNGDGKNDFFIINTIKYFPKNKLEIFNRWGNLIYYKNSYNNDFEGKANVGNSMGNGLLPAATYFVVFDYGDGSTKPYAGYLEITY